MSATDLYRLTGIKDKTETGLPKIETKYLKLFEYLQNCKDVNIIFDRTFFTEEIYGRLGYKSYSFTDTYNRLLKELDKLDFEIYLIVLYLKDTNIYSTRIKRDKHQYQKFEVESSIKQQEEYLKLADEVEKQTHNIKVLRIATDEANTNEILEKNLGFLFE